MPTDNTALNRPASDNGDCVKSEHVALARSRAWDAGDPWHFIAYCRLLLGLPEDGPAPYYLIDRAIHPLPNPSHPHTATTHAPDSL